MNLELLNDGVAGEKPWLNPVFNNGSCLNLTAIGTITASSFIGPITPSPTLLLTNQSSTPANPPSGKSILYTDINSNLIVKDSAGDTHEYVFNLSGLGTPGNFVFFQTPSDIVDLGYSQFSVIRNQATMAPANGPILTNSTATTSLLGPVVGAGLTIPPNQLSPGSSMTFNVVFTILASITSSELTIVPTLNGVAIDSEILSLGVQVNELYTWSFTWLYSAVNSTKTYGVLTNFNGTSYKVTSGSTFAFDPTIPCVIDFVAAWDTANAGNQVQVNTYFVTRNL